MHEPIRRAFEKYVNKLAPFTIHTTSSGASPELSGMLPEII